MGSGVQAPECGTRESRWSGRPGSSRAFLGISFMASTIGIVPDPSEENTVLSQVARVVVGDGAFFIVIQARPSRPGVGRQHRLRRLPALSSFLARDSFMPGTVRLPAASVGVTTGIVALSGLAALLLLVFDASVTASFRSTRSACSSRSPSPVEHGRSMVATSRARLAPRNRDHGLGAITTRVIAPSSSRASSGGRLVVVIAIPGPGAA